MCTTNQYKPLSFGVSDIEGSVFLSCPDTFALGLVIANDKLDKKLPGSAKIVISHADRSDVFTISKKTQTGSAEQPVNKF